jgi:hypothetical protein
MQRDTVGRVDRMMNSSSRVEEERPWGKQACHNEMLWASTVLRKEEVAG